MTRAIATSIAIVSILAMVPSAVAQSPDDMLRGMVWSPPEDLVQARQDLYDMHAAGVEAVRTPMVGDLRLFSVAEALGMVFFQDLPLEALGPGRYVQRANELEEEIRRYVADRAHFNAAGFVGVGHLVDTSDEKTCTAIRRLSEVIREASAGRIRTYYTTVFIGADACGESVDLVLLHTSPEADLRSVIAEWRDAHPGIPVGLAGIGRHVVPGTRGGLNRPHSPQAQARYLEQQLAAVADMETLPAALFIRAWRDTPARHASPEFDLMRPHARSFGMLDEAGVPRPAMQVVSGFFLSQQTTFAFDRGDDVSPSANWPLLFGWIVVLLFAVTFASEMRFRLLVTRYFFAHGLYQEGVRDGRELSAGVVIMMLAMISLSVGVFAAIAADFARTGTALPLVVAWLSEPLRNLIVGGLARPWALVLLVALLFAVSALLWASLLVLLTRGRHVIGLFQGLALVIWPCWPLLLSLLGVMVAPALERPIAGVLLATVAAIWFVVAIVGMSRTLRDYASVSRVPFWRVAMGMLAHPLTALLIVAFLLAIWYGPEFTYLQHLLMRR
jgi:hypothetical protein